MLNVIVGQMFRTEPGPQVKPIDTQNKSSNHGEPAPKEPRAHVNRNYAILILRDCHDAWPSNRRGNEDECSLSGNIHGYSTSGSHRFRGPTNAEPIVPP